MHAHTHTWIYINTHLLSIIYQVIRRAEGDIKVVSRKRNYYRKICKDTREKMKAIFNKHNTFCPPPVTLCFAAMLFDCTVHYSFDKAQKVT